MGQFNRENEGINMSDVGSEEELQRMNSNNLINKNEPKKNGGSPNDQVGREEHVN